MFLHNGVKLLFKFKFLPYYFFFLIIYIFDGFKLFMDNYFTFIENKKNPSPLINSNQNSYKVAYKPDQFYSGIKLVGHDLDIKSTVSSPDVFSVAPVPDIMISSPCPEMSAPCPKMSAPCPENSDPEIKIFTETHKISEPKEDISGSLTSSANVLFATSQEATQRGRRRLLNNK